MNQGEKGEWLRMGSVGQVGVVITEKNFIPWFILQGEVENLNMEERRLDDRIRFIWLIYI